MEQVYNVYDVTIRFLGIPRGFFLVRVRLLVYVQV